MDIQVPSSVITASFALSPSADRSSVDANQLGDVELALGGFQFAFTSGPCADSLLGPVIQARGAAQIEPLVRQSFVELLADPDGGGPQDAVLADAFEVALAAFDVPTALGQTLSADVDARYSRIVTDADGLSFSLDAALTSLEQLPGAPVLPGSFALEETPPSFPALTPALGLPYGLGLGISPSAFNQVLTAQIEGGLLRQDGDEIDIGIGHPLPLDTGLLGVYLPELSHLPKAAVVVQLRPTQAPLITGEPGPEGELLSLRTGGLRVRFWLPAQQRAFLDLAVDLELGADLEFGEDGLGFHIGTFHPELAKVQVVSDAVGFSAQHLDDLVAALFPLSLPLVEEALGTFVLPPVAGIPLQGIEAGNVDGSIGLFLDFAEAPASLSRPLER